jgi:hypothetical protein
MADTRVRDLAAAMGHVEGPAEWPVVGADRVPVGEFGKDHWSTFAYVETRTVDYDGQLSHDQMRCNPNRHPMLHAAKRRGMLFDRGVDKEYPTRLLGGIERYDHDDYDCLDDLVAAGLLAVEMPQRGEHTGWWGIPGTRRAIPASADVDTDMPLTGLTEQVLSAYARWSLTPKGVEIAAILRKHKADGGTWAQFGVAARKALLT